MFSEGYSLERDQAGYDANVATWQPLAERAVELKSSINMFADECQKAHTRAERTAAELESQRELVKQLVTAHATLREQGYQPVDDGFLEAVPQRFAAVDEQIAARCYGEASELIDEIDQERTSVLATIKKVPALHKQLLERMELLQEGWPTSLALLTEACANLAPARLLHAQSDWEEAAEALKNAEALAERWQTRFNAAQAAISKQTTNWKVAESNVKRLEDDALTIGTKCQRVIELLSEVDELARTLADSVSKEQAKLSRDRKTLADYRGEQGLARQDLAETAEALSALADKLRTARPGYRDIHEQLVNLKASRKLILDAAEKRHRKAVRTAEEDEAARRRAREDDYDDDGFGDIAVIGTAVLGGLVLGELIDGDDGDAGGGNESGGDWGGEESISDGGW